MDVEPLKLYLIAGAALMLLSLLRSKSTDALRRAAAQHGRGAMYASAVFMTLLWPVFIINLAASILYRK